MAVFNIDQISALLFKGTRENSVNQSLGKNQTTIIYGTAITSSSNGSVTVKLDDAIYSADDANDDYEYLTLSDDDDIDAVDQDIELIDYDDPQYDQDDQDIIFWQWQDDQATEQEN